MVFDIGEALYAGYFGLIVRLAYGTHRTLTPGSHTENSSKFMLDCRICLRG